MLLTDDHRPCYRPAGAGASGPGDDADGQDEGRATEPGGPDQAERPVQLLQGEGDADAEVKGTEALFDLTTHSTLFIYGYMASDVW